MLKTMLFHGSCVKPAVNYEIGITLADTEFDGGGKMES